MQISINAINGQCLLAIKTAQRLLVSGSKMDDQWPQRSQRSKMTITLKCNLCRPPAPGPSGWCRPCGPSASPCQTRPRSATLPAQPSSRADGLRASWAVRLSVHTPMPYCAAVLLGREPTHLSPQCCPSDIPCGAAKGQTCGLASRPLVLKQTLASPARNAAPAS